MGGGGGGGCLLGNKYHEKQASQIIEGKKYVNSTLSRSVANVLNIHKSVFHKKLVRFI